MTPQLEEQDSPSPTAPTSRPATLSALLRPSWNGCGPGGRRGAQKIPAELKHSDFYFIFSNVIFPSSFEGCFFVFCRKSS